jgi:hypothetical protein
MAPHSKFSAKAGKARGLVESALRHAGTRGQGRTTVPRGRTRASTASDVRRVALRAREAFRK